MGRTYDVPMRTLVLVVALTVFGVACGGDGSDTVSSASGPTVTLPSAGPVEEAILDGSWTFDATTEAIHDGANQPSEVQRWTFQADCQEVPCYDSEWQGQMAYEDASFDLSIALNRNDADWFGNEDFGDVGCHDGRDQSLSIELHVDDAASVDGVWRATQMSGRIVCNTAQEREYILLVDGSRDGG